MQKNINDLIKKIQKYSFEDILKFEENDRQFIALKRLYSNIKNKAYFLPLILVNSIIAYQLSSSGEDYWEEFSREAGIFQFSDSFKIEEISSFFEEFLCNCKWNKRILNMKFPRLNKFLGFFDDFSKKERFYYENMTVLRDNLASFLKQKKSDKTIVFAIKIFSYWARIQFDQFIQVPFEIAMPMDSRIDKITKIYNNENINTIDFWFEVSKKVGIPCIHLDALLWCNMEEFI